MKKNTYIIIGIVLIAVAVIAYIFWQNIQELFASDDEVETIIPAATNSIAGQTPVKTSSAPTGASASWATNDEVYVKCSSTGAVNVRTGAGSNFDSVGSYANGYLLGTFQTKIGEWVKFTPVSELLSKGSPLFIHQDYCTSGSAIIGSAAGAGSDDNIFSYIGGIAGGYE